MVEGHVLGTLLADAAARWYADGLRTPPQLLMPVPLTWRRLAQRGHNQALTLARPVARLLGVPLWRLGAKRRAGEHQRGSSRGQRLRNPAGVFATRHRWAEPGPCIAIVDDVMTTGATAAALTRVLLAAGAREVHVLCATRTRP